MLLQYLFSSFCAVTKELQLFQLCMLFSGFHHSSNINDMFTGYIFCFLYLFFFLSKVLQTFPMQLFSFFMRGLIVKAQGYKYGAREKKWGKLTQMGQFYKLFSKLGLFQNKFQGGSVLNSFRHACWQNVHGSDTWRVFRHCHLQYTMSYFASQTSDTT